MSLPDGFIDRLREQSSLADVAGAKVTWDRRKSNPGKGDYWAPCPFHQEKTASFHVDDRKGFYYCFGCHAKGNIFTFVQETENIGFMDAVKRLADRAGVAMPERDPKAAAQADRRSTLVDVMEQAVRYYRLQLAASAGQSTRDYLSSARRLSAETQARFEIGFAPVGRRALFEALTAKGIPPADIVAAGLAIEPDDGGQPFDRFRNRIMFPIRDGRGQAIAFGGRALDPAARAKYLNSNETLLFDKGRALYHLAPAREAAGKTGALIVAEGYMDVIALAAVGLDHAVAPLGTAITADQLEMLWRIADEPVIALDGDKAGLRAAMRLIDLALPKLSPGKTLRFCLMPEGQDPDDLTRAGGRAAMEAVLAEALPLSEMVWRREIEAQSLDSPERRAAFDARLKAVLGAIADPSVRGHYAAEFRARRRALFAPPPREPRQSAGRGPMGAPFGRSPMRPTVETRATGLVGKAADSRGHRLREAVILAGCLTHPAIAAEFEEALERLPMTAPDLALLRDRLVDVLASGEDPGTQLGAQLGGDPIARLGLPRSAPCWRVIGPGQPAERVRQALREEIARHRALLGFAEELKDAESAVLANRYDGIIWRIGEAVQARDEGLRAPTETAASDEIEFENGLRVSRDEREAFEAALQEFSPKKR